MSSKIPADMIKSIRSINAVLREGGSKDVYSIKIHKVYGSFAICINDEPVEELAWKTDATIRMGLTGILVGVRWAVGVKDRV